MSKLPSILLDTAAFIAGTQDMSACEVGVYIRLLMYQHQHGHVPNDDSRMMRITGVFDTSEWENIWSIVGKKFDIVGNHLVNQRLAKGCESSETKSEVKRISATFAGLISSSDLSPMGVSEIKKSFNVNDYKGLETSEMKKTLKSWFTKMVNQMVGGTVNNLYFNSLYNKERVLNKGVQGETVNQMVDQKNTVENDAQNGFEKSNSVNPSALHPQAANGKFVAKASSSDPADVLDIKSDAESEWMNRMMMNHQCTQEQIIATFDLMRSKEMRLSDVPHDAKKWRIKLQNYIFNEYSSGKYAVSAKGKLNQKKTVYEQQ